LEWLRSQHSPIRRLPTVMLTSSTHRKDVDRAYERGANAYFAKPESMKDLAALLGDFKSFWFRRIEFPETELPAGSLPQPR
jgi:DNA-binding NarL/FixJ family response regulator